MHMALSYNNPQKDSATANRFMNFVNLCGFAPLVWRWSDKSQLLGKTKGNGAKAHSSGGDKPPLCRKQR